MISNFDTPTQLEIQKYAIARDLLLRKKAHQLKTFFDTTKPKTVFSGTPKALKQITQLASPNKNQKASPLNPYALATSVKYLSLEESDKSPKSSSNFKYRIGKLNRLPFSPRSPMAKSEYQIGKKINDSDLSPICWTARAQGSKVKTIKVNVKHSGFSTSPAKHSSLVSDQTGTTGLKKVSRFEDYIGKISISAKKP